MLAALAASQGGQGGQQGGSRGDCNFCCGVYGVFWGIAVLLYIMRFVWVWGYYGVLVALVRMEKIRNNC